MNALRTLRWLSQSPSSLLSGFEPATVSLSSTDSTYGKVG